MADRHAERARRLLFTRIRVGLSLGIALGIGSVGTMALWSSSAVIDGGTVTAGQLDVTVDGALAGRANLDGTLTEAQWATTDLLPGERRALAITIANPASGTIPVDVRLDTYATGTLASALRVTVFDGGIATNTGGSLTAPTGYRSATCPGGTQTGAADQSLGTTAAAATVVDSTRQRLTSGQSMTYCVIVTLDDSATTHANTGLLDAKATVSFVIRGTQVGAP
jgi:predicted ribosomally synthesized peptide with SipW-like signal peptide